MLNKIEYDNGFLLIYDESVTDEDLIQFKNYIDMQNQFLNENEITWVKGTILKGSGTTFMDWNGMCSVKQCKSINAFFCTAEQYKSIKLLIEKWFENVSPVETINDMIDSGGCLFLANLNQFIIDTNMVQKSVNNISSGKRIELKKIKSVKPITNSTNKVKETTNPKPSSKVITLADIFKLKRK